MMASAVSAESDFKPVIKDYVGYKLRQKGLVVPGYDRDEDCGHLREVCRTMRRVGEELESENRQLFANMCDQLQINESTAYNTFQAIADEIFNTGKNWGRIVAFIVFGATLAVHSASRNDMGHDYVDTVVNWITRYMEVNLKSWMQSHDFWDGFNEFFQKHEDQENGRRNGFIFSALAGLGIGALLMLSVK